MELTLNWQGPVGPGLFPKSDDGLDALATAGIYLRVKQYEYAGKEPRTVAYVGQSKQLAVRFDQHLRDVLTFSSVLRDDTGSIALARDGISRYQAYNSLDAVLSLVAAEAARMRFFWATCEDGFDIAYLNLIEGALKTSLEEQVTGGRAFACENRQGIGMDGLDEEIIICHSYDCLLPSDAALITTLLGGGPIRLSVSPAGFDYVG